MDQYRSKPINLFIILVTALCCNTFKWSSVFPAGVWRSRWNYSSVHSANGVFRPWSPGTQVLSGVQRGKQRGINWDLDAAFAGLFLACHNLALFFSLVENGGAADQDEKRKADFHPLLRLRLQRSAREVLTRLSASWQTPVSRTFDLFGDAVLISGPGLQEANLNLQLLM